MSDDRLVPLEHHHPGRRPRRGIYLLLGLAVSGWLGFLVLAGVLLVTQIWTVALPVSGTATAEAARQMMAAVPAEPEPAQPEAIQPPPVVLQPPLAPELIAILATYEARRSVQERVRHADALDHENGDVSAARGFYEYAAARGWAPAALALAFTYDPHELQRRGVTIAPDPHKARACYLMARELMDATVAFYLSRLPPDTGEKC